jgi:hypothetical protein
LKSAKNESGIKKPLLALLGIALAAALAEFAMGRRLWGVGGVAGLWSADIWSERNSQFFFDPYTFTHVTHGILLCAIVSWVAPKLPLSMRLMIAVGLEGIWEVFENTDFTINRYRAETVSLNYYGDSVMNSMGDILACIAGFSIASRLPGRATIALIVALEIILVVWTRDNLTLNIVMLIHPSSLIRAWQLAR